MSDADVERIGDEEDGAEPSNASLEHFDLTEAAGAISARIAEAMGAGTQERINLYAALEGLGGEIIGLLLMRDRQRPDDSLVMFVRRILELLVGRFTTEAAQIARWLLTDAPSEIIVAVAKVAIEDVRGAEEGPARSAYESVIQMLREISRGTEAAGAVESMYREARDGQR